MPIKRPAKLAHVVYRTRRFDEMIQWYTSVFCAKVQFANPALAFLTFDDEHHRFAIANISVLVPGGTETNNESVIGVDHVGYTHSSIGDLLDNYGALKEAGVEPYWCVHHGVTVSMYYADPDGNQMEFQVDCVPAGTDTSDFMAVTFTSNPIGVEYDPEVWFAQHRNGGIDAEFVAAAYIGPVSPIRGAFARIMEN